MSLGVANMLIEMFKFLPGTKIIPNRDFWSLPKKNWTPQWWFFLDFSNATKLKNTTQSLALEYKFPRTISDCLVEMAQSHRELQPGFEISPVLSLTTNDTASFTRTLSIIPISSQSLKDAIAPETIRTF